MTSKESQEDVGKVQNTVEASGGFTFAIQQVQISFDFSFLFFSFCWQVFSLGLCPSSHSLFLLLWIDNNGHVQVRQMLVREKQPTTSCKPEGFSRFVSPSSHSALSLFWSLSLFFFSADEPMTTFHTCIPCGHRWKS